MIIGKTVIDSEKNEEKFFRISKSKNWKERNRMFKRERIESNNYILNGKPIIKAIRISVEFILELFSKR